MSGGERESVAGREEGERMRVSESAGVSVNVGGSESAGFSVNVGGSRRRRRRPFQGEVSSGTGTTRQLGVGWSVSPSPSSGSGGEESAPAAKKNRGPRFTTDENLALVAAVTREKATLFTTTVASEEKFAAWKRVRDAVVHVGGKDRSVECIRKRYYDCKASVMRKIKKRKAFRDWEQEFQNNLLQEGQSETGIGGPHMSPESESAGDQPGPSSGRMVRQHNLPHSPVLSSAAPADIDVEEEVSPAEHQALSPTLAPGSVPRDTHLVRENQRLAKENRNMSRELRRMNRTMLELHRLQKQEFQALLAKQMSDFQAMLSHHSQQQMQAINDLRVDVMSAIATASSQRLPVPDPISSGSNSSNTPTTP